MASSIKLLLRKKPNKQGLYPLVIRITKDRKSNYVYTGHYIEAKYWNATSCKVKKSHPNSNRLNNFLDKKLAQLSATLLDLQSHDKDVSSKQIKTQVIKHNGKENFYTVSQRYLAELDTHKKYNQYHADKGRINNIINYVGAKQLAFKAIDEDFLRKLTGYLNSKYAPQTVANHLAIIRTIYNRAIKEGVVDRRLYPFGVGKIKIKFPQSKKIGLSTTEVKAIEDLTALTPEQAHARRIWLFSFYLAGMRVGDVLKIKWSDIYDDRLHYRMNKNAKLLSLKLPEKLHPILEAYSNDKTHDDDYIFPELKKVDTADDKAVLKASRNANQKFNSHLVSIAKKANITKKLTMHIARHTFGNISGDSIPIQTLQKLYRHSSITTTINYQANFVHKDFDEALDSVINF